MNTNIFAARFCEAMKRKGWKQADVIRIAQEKGVKLGKSQISQYSNGKTIPRENVMRDRKSVV